MKSVNSRKHAVDNILLDSTKSNSVRRIGVDREVSLPKVKAGLEITKPKISFPKINQFGRHQDLVQRKQMQMDNAFTNASYDNLPEFMPKSTNKK